MEIYCLHCGLKNNSKNEQEKFCCKGCNLAYKMINDLGLQNYYHTRLINQNNKSFNTKSLKPEENNQIDVGEFINFEYRNTDENYYSLNLMVEGLHCAACVWLIESVLKKQSGVTKARINMTNKKLYLEWLLKKEIDQKTTEESAKIIGNGLVHLIFNLGYKLIPFDIEFLKAEEKKYDSQVLKALCIAGFASGNVMLISVALWSSSSEVMGLATRNLLYWISALISLPAIIYSGRIFVVSAFKSIKLGRMNMDVPIAVAIFLASIISIFEAITQGEHAYFDSVIMLIFFLLIGRYLDFAARKKAFSITTDLIMLSGTSATIIVDGKNKIIASKDLKQGMILNITMGERIAADGVIIKGETEIDTAIITGESLPKRGTIGSDVFAGTINLGNAVQVKITKAKEETLLARIVKMVEKIENGKNYYTKIADVVAKYYTPCVHLIALITFLVWCFIFKIGWHHALLNAAAVLIITCPCALALAVPVVQIVSAGILLKQGILLKNGEALEKLNKIDTIVFDKTGTLTLGKPSLVSVLFENKLFTKINKEISTNQLMIMQIAASMAAKSKHVLSQALLSNFKNNFSEVSLLDLEVEEVAGMGLISSHNGEEIRLGNSKYCDINEEKIFDDIEKNLPQIYFKYQNQISIFTFEDQLKSDAALIIDQLKHYKIILLSGDKKSVVQEIAKQLGISEFYFEKTPDEKLKILQQLNTAGKNILMVGDGVNDAPSLMLANVSASPSNASDISKNIADIIFQGEKLQPILETIKIAKKSDRITKQNLAFALLYNLVAVPFAILGYIVPLFAALAMSSSSIIAVLNALRIKNKDRQKYFRKSNFGER